MSRPPVHGETCDGRPTPEYISWAAMKRRCLAETNEHFSAYGGRGITITPRWLGPEGFANFLEDMGRKPGPKHTLDRRNNNGNYEKNNCRWATKSEQSNNTRSNVMMQVGGETLTLAQLVERFRGEEPAERFRGRLCRRLGRGWSLDAALGTAARRWVPRKQRCSSCR